MSGVDLQPRRLTHEPARSSSDPGRLRLPSTVSLRALLPMLLAPTNQAGASDADAPALSSIASLVQQRRQFLRFLERRVQSPALAEDLLQNAYLRALEHAGELRADESSAAWFYRILRNAVIDFYRHREVESRALSRWAEELESEVAPHELTRDIVCGCIAKVLPSLSSGYACILKEIDLDEGSLADFAERHAITLGNATVRIHRARKALKRRLVETCGVCAVHECLNCNCVAGLT